MGEEQKIRVVRSTEGHFRIELSEGALASGVAKLLMILSEQLCQIVVLSESLHGENVQQASSSYDERTRRQLRAIYHFLLQHLPQDHKTLVDFRALFYQTLVRKAEQRGEQKAADAH